MTGGIGGGCAPRPAVLYAVLVHRDGSSQMPLKRTVRRKGHAVNRMLALNSNGNREMEGKTNCPSAFRIKRRTLWCFALSLGFAL